MNNFETTSLVVISCLLYGLVFHSVLVYPRMAKHDTFILGLTLLLTVSIVFFALHDMKVQSGP